MSQDAVSVMKSQDEMDIEKHKYFMQEALKEAKLAYDRKEVPVGAVLVYNGEIIARAHNLRETKNSSLAHAEILCISQAEKIMGWRLEDTTLYVTLEPCPMCSGAIIQSRIKKVYFGAYDPKAGACGSIFNLFSYPFNHHVTVAGGLMEDEARELLKSFFKELRQKSS